MDPITSKNCLIKVRMYDLIRIKLFSNISEGGRYVNEALVFLYNKCYHQDEATAASRKKVEVFQRVWKQKWQSLWRQRAHSNAE